MSEEFFTHHRFMDEWQQAKDLFARALELAPGERAEFLERACAGHDSLRHEVESLIASHQEDSGFMETPAVKDAAASLVADSLSSLVGQRLGRYQIVKLVGEGGMGEVYLTNDELLGRRVALKVLPSLFTKDEDRLRRFEQEARAASALNHPNILTIYEIGQAGEQHFIAMEYVDGETLRRRMTGERLQVVEAIEIAAQMAAALAAAHEAGIIHRDIKPENIMLRRDHLVKVLDFGLAKLTKSQKSSPDAATQVMVKTNPGVVMGTVNYMSPEQARGFEVDQRTDIWSLGAVLYEMVAGRDPFMAETQNDVVSLILQKEPPPLARYQPELPAELERIASKALRKDRDERYQTVKDMLLDLKALKQELEFRAKLEQSVTPETPRAATVAPNGDEPVERITADAALHTEEMEEASATAIIKPARSLMKNRLWPILALIALIAVGLTFGLYKFWSRNQSATTGQSAATDAPAVVNIARVTVWSGLDTQPTLSPDGNSVAYSSNHGGSFEIYIKQLTPGGREVQLTSDGQENFQPAWSPDGQRIVYYSKNRGGIWVVPTFGGAPKQLTDFGSSPKWSPDGSMIVFQSDANPDLGAGSAGSSTVWIIPAQGGTPKQITKVGNPAGGHVAPTWSPDNRRIAFVTLNFTIQQVWSVSVNGDDLKEMTHADGKAAYPVYAPDGRHLYFTGGPTMWVLRVSPENGAPIGDAVEVTDVGASFINSLTLSADGKRMAYSVQTLTSNIWSVPVSPSTDEANGPPQPITNQTGTRNNQPAFSPDGRKIAFMEFLRGGGADIWVADADGKNPVQVTASAKNLLPNWFPDGDQIAFSAYRGDHRSVWAISLQSRREHLLFDIGRSIEYARLSPDGKEIIFNLETNGITNVWSVPVSGGQPKQLTFDRELAGFACASPDGKLIAYQMKRGDDVYLMTIPGDGGEPTQLTSGHGRSWPYGFSPDGDKIVFAGERDGVWNVWWVSRSTKQQKQVTNYTKLNSYVRYPAWSPSGNQIAYEYAEMSGNIWIMNLK